MKPYKGAWFTMTAKKKCSKEVWAAMVEMAKIVEKDFDNNFGKIGFTHIKPKVFGAPPWWTKKQMGILTCQKRKPLELNRIKSVIDLPNLWRIKKITKKQLLKLYPRQK